MIEHHIVYKITNLLNNKFYIGVHKQYPGYGPEDFDGYLGSGPVIKDAVNKYGKENFLRETLYSYLDRQKAEEKEKELITEDLKKSKDCYNINDGGHTNYEACHTKEARTKAKRTKILKYGNPAGACHTKEARTKANNTTLNKFGSVAGHLHSPEVINSSMKTRTKKYGSPASMMHSEKALKSKREVLYNKFKKEVPTLDKIIEVKELDTGKSVWKGKLYHFNTGFKNLQYPKGNTKQVRRAYKILSGKGRCNYIRVYNKKYTLTYI